MTAYIDPAQKLLGHMDRLHELRTAGRTSAPVNVEIDLSNRCSRGCEFCHFAYTHTRGPLAGKHEKPEGALDSGDLMSPSLAVNILHQLAEAGVRSVTWTGGGEPTLHPDFDAIVAEAARTTMEQGLYTHGGHIDRTRAALLKQKMTWVYVSLDAATPEAYKRDKGVDGFEPVLQGVRNLVAVQGPATIGLGFLIHRKNMDDIATMIALGKGLGVDYVQFRPAIRYMMNEPDTPAEDREWVEIAMRWLRTYQGDPFVIADVDRFGMYRDWQGHSYGTCFWTAMQTVITPNGRVWRCCNTRERPGAMIGDLSQESFAEVWSKAGPVAVNEHCRVMCRGHIPNLTLAPIVTEQAHGNFI